MAYQNSNLPEGDYEVSLHSTQARVTEKQDSAYKNVNFSADQQIAPPDYEASLQSTESRVTEKPDSAYKNVNFSAEQQIARPDYEVSLQGTQARVTEKPDGVHKNITFSADQQTARPLPRPPATKPKTKNALSKLQIVFVCAIILNFALAIAGIILLLQNEMKRDALHNESVIKLKEEITELETEVGDVKSELSRFKNNSIEQEKKLEELKEEYNGSKINTNSKFSYIERTVLDAKQLLNETMKLAEERETRYNEAIQNLRDSLYIYPHHDYGSGNYVLDLSSTTDSLYIYLENDNGSRNYGRVEVLYLGVWGTICDDYWDANDAQVVCRMLGYHGPATAYRNAKYGKGYGRIWLDDVECTGNESTIWDCRKNAWGEHDCGHNEDASVYCNE